jgi:hypothetical protein
MGGEIGVESEFGEGATFFFTVALQQDEYNQSSRKDEDINRLIDNKRILLIGPDSVLNSYLLRLGRNWQLQMHAENTLASALVKLNEEGVATTWLL